MALLPRSLAGQAFALQAVVIALVVLAGGALALFDAKRDGDEAAREQVTAIAVALADAPSTAAAIESGDATRILQPMTEAVRVGTDIAFITIMAPDRTRFTHTNPDMIGGKYIGNIEPGLRGETFTEVYTGTLGPSIRAVAPVRSSSGQVVGLVAAGITEQSLAARWRSTWPAIAAVGLGALALSFVGVWAIRRRILRQTHGLAPDELRVMYDHHDAILHAVSEGLIVLDRDGVVLVNDEARRLLALPPGPIGHGDLPEFLRGNDPGVRDEVRVTDDRVLVLNRSQVSASDSEVVTIRDRTELQGALGELSALQMFSDSLRAQAHESANKLHTVITLVEMGRPEEAVKFATKELALSQQLVDRLSDAVGEPALMALLLGKTAEADERGRGVDRHRGDPTAGRRRRVGAESAGDGHRAGKPHRQRHGRVRSRGSLGGGHRQSGRRAAGDRGGRQRTGDGCRDLRPVNAARLFDEVRRRRGSSGSGSGAGRADRQAPRRHAERGRDLRLGGDGDRSTSTTMITVLIVEDDPLIAEAHCTYLARLEGFSLIGVAPTARDGMRIASEAARATLPSTWFCSTSDCPTPAASAWPRRCRDCGPLRTSSPSPPSATWRWCAPRCPTARWPTC